MLDFRGQVERALRALEQDRPAEAEKGFRAALEANPRDDQLLHLLGVCLVQQQRAGEALEPLRKAVSLNRRHAEYHNTLGCALRDAGLFAESLESFGRALKLEPQLDSARYNAAHCYQSMGEFARAEEAFRALLARRPQDVELIGALAKLRWFAADHEGAVQILRDGVARQPERGELRFLLADHLLALGRFEEGWRCYLWRTNRPRGAPARDAAPLEGSLAGRTFHLHGEQGLGDELFFLRFAPLLRERGARVRAFVSARIAGFVQRSGVVDEVAPPAAAQPAEAAELSLGDLPFLLEAHRREPPATLRYAPLAGKLQEIDARLAGLARPLTGLTWRAGTGPEAGNRNLLYKQASFDALATLARDLPGSVLVVQRRPSAIELEQLRAACGERIVDVSALNEDLEAMLALLARLDEYVGVSNTNMHLCAALGRPARVLVSRDAEFRWMAHGIESPWFPGMRVYRQAANGAWGSTIEALRNDLIH